MTITFAEDPLLAHPAPPRPSPILLEFMRPPVAHVIDRWWTVETHGEENLPQGASIVAPNHQGTLDAIVAVSHTPDSLAMAKRELFHGLLGSFLHRVGQVPVRRGECDVDAIRACLDALDDGMRLTVFPEGHRDTGDFTVFHHGVAYLAMVSGAPVVPLALLGTRRADAAVSALPRRGARVAVVYGEPVQVPKVAWPRRPEAVAELSARLQQACRDTMRHAEEITGLRRVSPDTRHTPRLRQASGTTPEHHQQEAS